MPRNSDCGLSFLASQYRDNVILNLITTSFWSGDFCKYPFYTTLSVCWVTYFELVHYISYKIACAPSEESDQPAHLRSLTKVFTEHSVSSQGSTASSATQRKLESTCTSAQADPSLRWAHIQCLVPVHLCFPSIDKQERRYSVAYCQPNAFCYIFRKVGVIKPWSAWTPV